MLELPRLLYKSGKSWQSLIIRFPGCVRQEWDAVVLSNYALEQQLHTARQELSHALYQVRIFSYEVSAQLTMSLSLHNVCFNYRCHM